MFIAALITIDNMETTQISIDRQMDKETVAYMYTMEYYSAFKKEEFLLFSTVWIDLKDIILSEISQSQKDKHQTISFV